MVMKRKDIRKVFDTATSLEELRRACQGATPSSLLARNCTPSILNCFNRITREYYRNGRLRLGNPVVVFKIIHELEKRGVERVLIDSYCKSEFPDDIVFPSIVIELLAYIFELDIGVFWSPGEVLRRCPDLEFDEDGLLVGPSGEIFFQRDGVRCGQYLIPYCQEIQKYDLDMSGGFLERLSGLIKNLAPSYIGLRIVDDMVYDPSRLRPYVTKAYIRGPKGLSVEILNSPDFPEDPRGTVTVHQRVSQDKVAQLDFPLISTDIMWSSKDGIKTVQIEELVPSGGSRNQDGAPIFNRYMHARWHPRRGHFIHVDGALRSYAEDVYGMRLHNDIKRSREVSAEYRKLFRVDAALPLDTWCDLTVRYFYHNELVLEYLGGPSEGGV